MNSHTGDEGAGTGWRVRGDRGDQTWHVWGPRQASLSAKKATLPPFIYKYTNSCMLDVVFGRGLVMFTLFCLRLKAHFISLDCRTISVIA